MGNGNSKNKPALVHSRSLENHRGGVASAEISSERTKKDPLKAIYDKYNNIHKKAGNKGKMENNILNSSH